MATTRFTHLRLLHLRFGHCFKLSLRTFDSTRIVNLACSPSLTAVILDPVCVTLFPRKTNLTITEIASRAGFRSLRRFNSSFTELYNRRHIMDVLDTECIRSCSHNSPLSILLMDVDNFKKINDTYGHQAGDVVLKEMGVLITAASGSRLIGRYGGEEFLVLLPQEDAANAWVTAERIRAVIEAATVVYDGEPIISPTLSIGIATTFGWKEKPEDLVGLADEALYAAKSAGRNRTCHAFESSGRRTVSKFTVVSPLNSQ